MLGDRVRIGATGTFKEQPETMVFVYKPVTKEDGTFMQVGDSTYLVESVGGVQAGSSGTIQGHPIKVNRSQLKNFSGVPGLGTVDSVLMFPVFLDKYQQIGWFPNDDVKIMAGGPA